MIILENNLPLLLQKLLELEHSQCLGFVISLTLSLIFTPLIIGYAQRLDLLSPGGGRHIHDTPTPRLGGIAIYLSCLITSLFFIIIYGRYTPAGFEHFELLGILIGATLIFLVGLFDDLSPLPAMTKLIAQIFTAVVVWLCNVKIQYVSNPLFIMNLSESRVIELDPIYSFILTILWLVLITNALNLIDGLDGLAGGVSLISAISLWAIFVDPQIAQPAGALLVATVAGAILGFLRSNYNPARIFLGDGGSYFLGFTLGATAITGLSTDPNTATVGSVIVITLLFPLIDTFWAVLRRMLAGRHIFQADANHIHHTLLKSGLSAKATMFIIYGTCILLGLVACSIVANSYKRYLILVLFVSSLAILNVFWKRESDKSRNDDPKMIP